jgi:hypothetical protein
MYFCVCRKPEGEVDFFLVNQWFHTHDKQVSSKVVLYALRIDPVERFSWERESVNIFLFVCTDSWENKKREGKQEENMKENAIEFFLRFTEKNKEGERKVRSCEGNKREFVFLLLLFKYITYRCDKLIE